MTRPERRQRGALEIDRSRGRTGLDDWRDDSAARVGLLRYARFVRLLVVVLVLIVVPLMCRGNGRRPDDDLTVDDVQYSLMADTSFLDALCRQYHEGDRAGVAAKVREGIESRLSAEDAIEGVRRACNQR